MDPAEALWQTRFALRGLYQQSAYTFLLPQASKTPTFEDYYDGALLPLLGPYGGRFEAVLGDDWRKTVVAPPAREEDNQVSWESLLERYEAAQQGLLPPDEQNPREKTYRAIDDQLVKE